MVLIFEAFLGQAVAAQVQERLHQGWVEREHDEENDSEIGVQGGLKSVVRCVSHVDQAAKSNHDVRGGEEVDEPAPKHCEVEYPGEPPRTVAVWAEQVRNQEKEQHNWVDEKEEEK